MKRISNVRWPEISRSAYRCGDLVGLDLIQGNDCNPLLKLAIVEKLAGDLLIVYHNVVQLPARADFEGSGLVEMRFVEGDE